MGYAGKASDHPATPTTRPTDARRGPLAIDPDAPIPAEAILDEAGRPIATAVVPPAATPATTEGRWWKGLKIGAILGTALAVATLLLNLYDHFIAPDRLAPHLTITPKIERVGTVDGGDGQKLVALR